MSTGVIISIILIIIIIIIFIALLIFLFRAKLFPSKKSKTISRQTIINNLQPQNIEPKIITCNKNQTCPNNLACVNFICSESKGNENDKCISNSDCNENLVCSNLGICIKKDFNDCNNGDAITSLILPSNNQNGSLGRQVDISIIERAKIKSNYQGMDSSSEILFPNKKDDKKFIGHKIEKKDWYLIKRKECNNNCKK